MMNLLLNRGDNVDVLSLFDGISCGQVALKRAGFKPDTYFASEIDDNAIKVTQSNYPKTIQLGDVSNVHLDRKIDLLMGGSPCQDLSIAKRTFGTTYGLTGEKSKLFWEYIRILNETQPTYFLFENVARMESDDRYTITKELGVKPIKINSSLVSGQQRERLYWTNIPVKHPPKDKGILFRDIIKNDRKWFDLLPWCLKTWGKSRKVDGLRTIEADKSFCVTTNKSHPKNYYLNRERNQMTKLDADEVEILQTLPIGYTNMIPESKRFHAIGNGWTVDIVSHILSFMK